MENNLTVVIENVNGVLVTSSNRVAEELGVSHKHLLEKIDNYIDKFKTSDQFYIPSNYMGKNCRAVRNYLITKKGMEMIIQNSCFTKVEQLEKSKLIYEELGGKGIEVISAFTRFEISFVDMLEKALKELGIKGIRQYRVGNYRIDFYIPKSNIAVEYDEKQHEYQVKEDKAREDYIKRELSCKFIRCDYKVEDIINVMKVVKEVM